MSRPTGLAKTGGRKAGTPNQRSSDLRERIEQLLKGKDLPELILSKLKDLSLQEEVQVLLALMPYVYPKRKAMEVAATKSMTFSDFISASMGDEGDDDDDNIS